jgi:hypothetical protein
MTAAAFLRAAIQTHMDLRDINTCRRALLVRARFRRSIGPNSEKIYDMTVQQQKGPDLG